MTPLILAALAQAMLQPPIHRAWTVITGDSTVVQAIRGGVLYYTSQQGAGAIDLATGKAKWTTKLPWCRGGGVGATEMIVLTQGAKSNRVFALDLKAGSERNLGAFGEETSDITADSKRFYLLHPGAVVAGYRVDTGKQIWTTPLLKNKKGRGSRLATLVAGNGKLFAAVEGPGFHCLDPVTGKVLWKDTGEYGTYLPPILTPTGVITHFNGVKLRDYATGKPKWDLPSSFFQPFALAGTILIAKDDNRLTGVSLATGKRVWQYPPPKDNSFRVGGRDGLFPSDGKSALLVDDKLSCVTIGGHELWSIDPPVAGMPVYADDKRFVFSDHERILGYTSGDLQPLPEGEEARKALAIKMVADFELLDQLEMQQVAELAPYATKPLIRKYATWAIDNREEGAAHKEGRGQMLYGLLTDTDDLLMKMVGKEDTEALVTAIETVGPKNGYVDNLVAVLGAKGDPDRVIPMYVGNLRANRPKPDSYENGQGGVMLDAVANSKHHDAVAFMIEALADPKAPDSWRHEAFVHLPGTGGDAGVAAVLKARAQRSPRPTWEDKFAESRPRAVSEKKDSKGRIWRLASSGVLGNYSDLYLQEKLGSSWSKPVFLNFFTQRTWTQQPPKDYRGFPVAKFLAGEWVKLLPGDASLGRDQDKDGLTDLAESRLGTDPSKADTDGDGLNDSVDPCPNAAPRALGDREKIVAACVEARFFAEDWGTPAMIEVNDIQPFELYGYPRPLLWETAGYKGTLPAMYNTGVNSLNIDPPIGDMQEDTRGKPIIEISPDGRTARTTIRRYSGGLNGDGILATLVKIGDEWFVTSLEMKYVS